MSPEKASFSCIFCCVRERPLILTFGSTRLRLRGGYGQKLGSQSPKQTYIEGFTPCRKIRPFRKIRPCRKIKEHQHRKALRWFRGSRACQPWPRKDRPTTARATFRFLTAASTFANGPVCTSDRQELVVCTIAYGKSSTTQSMRRWPGTAPGSTSPCSKAAVAGSTTMVVAFRSTRIHRVHTKARARLKSC